MKLTVRSEDGAVSDAIHEIVASGQLVNAVIEQQPFHFSTMRAGAGDTAAYRTKYFVETNEHYQFEVEGLARGQFAFSIERLAAHLLNQ